MRLKHLINRVPQYIRKHGIAKFGHYLITTTLLTILSWLLIPFKKKTDTDSFYQVFNRFIASVNELQQPTLLEIGSRNVTGVVWREAFQPGISYTGLDVHQGENVDVVGDAHQLSSYLPNAYYDAVFSVSVFEHLAMPWKAAIEINKVLKPGGLLYISTHPVWPANELPWDFWRYSSETFKTLLNEKTGFEILESRQGTPGQIISLSRDPATSGIQLAPIYLSIAVLALKTGIPDPGLSWDIPISSMLRSHYPKPDATQAGSMET